MSLKQWQLFDKNYSQVSLNTSQRLTMKSWMIVALLTGVLGTSLAQLPGLAQSSTYEARVKEIEALSRAKNLARQAAEAANGGLLKYRAELSMHGSAAKSPFVDRGDYWIFTFKGNVPGVTEPSIESEVRVDKANFKTTVLYNGAIRSQR